MEIFKLFGTILVDSSKAEESISKTEGKASGLASSLGSGIKAVAGFAAGVGAAAIAGGAALFGMAQQSAEATDRIDKMSQKLGLSAKGFQEWDYIMGQNGISIDSLQGSMAKFTTNIEAGSDKVKGLFDEIGVSIEGMSKDEAFNATVEGLQGVEDETRKAYIAQQLFGKGGAELLPLLNQTAEGTEELRQRAYDLGLVLSEDTVNAGVVLGDTLDDVKASFGMIVTQVGAQVMPLAQKFCDWLLQYMPVIQEVLSKVFEFIGLGVGYVVEWIAGLKAAFDDWVTNNQDTVTAIMDGLKALWEWLKGLFESIVDIITVFIEVAQALWEEWGDVILEKVRTVWNMIKLAIDQVLDFIRTLFSVFSKLFKGDWEGAWNDVVGYFQRTWERIKEFLANALDNIVNGLIMVGVRLFAAAQEAFDSIHKGFTEIWEKVKAWFEKAKEDPVTAILSILTSLYEAGKSIFNSLWDGLKSVWTGITDWISDCIDWIKDKVAFWKSESDKVNKKKSSKDDDDYDGSHATGLAYVPYDNYRANLHKGERVLTADENREYEGYSGDGKVVQQTVNIYSNRPLSPAEIAEENKRALKELALGF